MSHSRRALLSSGARQQALEVAEEHVARQGGFAGAGYSRDHGQTAKRNARIDFAQVVQRCPEDANRGRIAIHRAAQGARMAQRRRETSTGCRELKACELCGAALRHQAAASCTGAGTEIDHMIGPADGVLIVLDHHQRIALGAQPVERIEERPVIPRMQTNGGLVQHVTDPLQIRTELRRQPDALRFAARKGGGGTVELQIAESHVAQERSARAELGEQVGGDLEFAAVEFESTQGGVELRHRQVGERCDRAAAKQHVARHRDSSARRRNPGRSRAPPRPPHSPRATPPPRRFARHRIRPK